MKYQKEELEKELAKLVGKTIAEIYYYNRYELFESFTQLTEKVECVILSGILLKTTDGTSFNIQDHDYFPNLSLGGMTIQETTDPVNPPDRKNHYTAKQWTKYHDSEITTYQVHEIAHTKGADTYTVPLGISIDFKNGETLHIYNAFVEDYLAGQRKYDICPGESLTFFYDTKSLNEYPDLADGQTIPIEDYN